MLRIKYNAVAREKNIPIQSVRFDVECLSAIVECEIDKSVSRLFFNIVIISKSTPIKHARYPLCRWCCNQNISADDNLLPYLPEKIVHRREEAIVQEYLF